MTKNQLKCYHILAAKAFNAHCEQQGNALEPGKERKAAYEQWRRKINLDQTGKSSSAKMTNAQFDCVMLELAIIAGDDYWIGRTSSNDCRMLRWILRKQFIPDLENLEQRPISWSYIEGIFDRAHVPKSMEDCPEPMLKSILQMVDTHIRRLAKRRGVALIDLPSGQFRKGIRPANKAMAIYRHDHHHHIHHGDAA